MSFHVVVEGNTTMRYRIVEKESFRVVGRKARVPLVHEGVNAAAAAHVESLDEQAIVRMKELAGREPEGILSAVVYLTDSREEGAEVDHWIGVVTGPEAAAEELDALDVPDGTWAVFDNPGPIRAPSRSCGETCSRSGSPRTRTRAGQVRSSCGRSRWRSARRPTPSCGSRSSGAAGAPGCEHQYLSPES
jgi:predicted transcriptional regulator YdeE